MKAGVVLNPATPLESIQHVLHQVDLILLMSGEHLQSSLPSSLFFSLDLSLCLYLIIAPVMVACCCTAVPLSEPATVFGLLSGTAIVHGAESCLSESLKPLASRGARRGSSA